MADNVQNAMFDILKRIQSDVSELKTDVVALKELAIKQRRDSAALLVMFRSTVGHFDERVSKLEDDVQLLKDRR